MGPSAPSMPKPQPAPPKVDLEKLARQRESLRKHRTNRTDLRVDDGANPSGQGNKSGLSIM